MYFIFHLFIVLPPVVMYGNFMRFVTIDVMQTYSIQK